MKKARLLPIDALSPAMELWEDVTDGQGHRLIGAGTLLTEALIQALLRRGVTHATVAVEETLSPEETAARRAAVEERLKRLFRHRDGDPLMQRLKALVLAYRLEQ